MRGLQGKNGLQNQKTRDRKLLYTNQKCKNKPKDYSYHPPGSIVYNTVPKYFDVSK